MHNFETLELTLAYDTTHALNFKFNADSVVLGRLVKKWWRNSKNVQFSFLEDLLTNVGRDLKNVKSSVQCSYYSKIVYGLMCLKSTLPLETFGLNFHTGSIPSLHWKILEFPIWMDVVSTPMEDCCLNFRGNIPLPTIEDSYFEFNFHKGYMDFKMD